MRALGLALLLAVLVVTPASAAETKYSLANGCFELKAVNGLGEPTGLELPAPLRLKATALGQYLLYTKDGKFLAGTGHDLAIEDEPSEGAEWLATTQEGFLELTSLGGGPTLAPDRRTTGCAEYPEIELNVTGAPSK